MRYAVTHGVHQRPWHFRVRGGKCGVMKLHVVGSFTQNLKVADHGVLRFLVFKEGQLRRVLDLAVDAVNGLHLVLKVIHATQDVALGHTARASATTWPRNFAGRPLGVSTSTATGSNCESSS